MKSKIIGLQILNALILGVTYAVSKFGLQQMGSMQLLSFRFLFAAGVVAVCILTGRMTVDFSAGFHPLLLLYCAQPVLYYILETSALQRLPSAYVSIVLSAVPISTSFFGWLLLRETIGTKQFFCLLLSTGGVVGINLYGMSASSGLSTAGLLFAAGALLLNGLGSILCKKMLGTYSATTLTAMDMGVKAVAFTAIGLTQAGIFGGGSFVSFFAPLGNPACLGVAVFLGLFPSVIFNVIQLYCLKSESVSAISVFMNLTPVFTLIVGSLFLRESVGAVELLCLGAVILGLSGYIMAPSLPPRAEKTAAKQAVNNSAERRNPSDGTA